MLNKYKPKSKACTLFTTKISSVNITKEAPFKYKVFLPYHVTFETYKYFIFNLRSAANIVLIDKIFIL